MAAVDPVQQVRSRGLTLFEVLIALGIILALSAIVLPIASWSLRLGSLESARDGVEAVLLQARASARLEGRAIEVFAGGGRIEARWFDAANGFSGANAIEADDITSLEATLADPVDFDELRITNLWARRRLPADITVLDVDDYLETLEESDMFGSSVDKRAPVEFVSSRNSELRLGVFLPDGGALVGQTAVLVGSDGKAIQISVDPWTARPVIGPVLEKDPDAFEETDDDELEPDEADDIERDLPEPEPEPVTDTRPTAPLETEDPLEDAGS
jgi:type II secretory pathway pseudopilin PulG